MSAVSTKTRTSGRDRAWRVFVSAAVWLIVFCFASPAAAADGPRLLMLPIVVHSAEDPEYLRSGLSDMLASRFERLGVLELVRADEGGRGTSDPDKAMQLARKRGADFVLFGSFTRFGQGASLDVQCAPVARSGEPGVSDALREIFVHSGSIGDIIPDLDELAGKVSRYVRGENVATAAPAAFTGGGGAGAGSAEAAAEIEELSARVDALEATLADVVEAIRDSPGGDLR